MMRISFGASPRGASSRPAAGFVSARMRRGSRRAGAATAALASRAASARDGAVCSSAHDSRWRATGRCTSQQLTVQNWSAVRLRLHVDTLQVKYVAP